MQTIQPIVERTQEIIFKIQQTQVTWKDLKIDVVKIEETINKSLKGELHSKQLQDIGEISRKIRAMVDTMIEQKQSGLSMLQIAKHTVL